MSVVEELAEDAATAAVPELGLPLRILGWCKSGVTTAFTWLTASATHLLIVSTAIGVGVAIYERHEADKWHLQATHIAAAKASEEQAAAAVAAKASAHYKENNDAAQSAHDALAADNGRLNAMLAARRVSVPAATLVAVPIAGVPAIPADRSVLADANDLRTCDADYVYAQAAYEWAQGLNH